MKKKQSDRQSLSEYEMAVEQMISEGGPVFENIAQYLKWIRSEDDETDQTKPH